MTVLHKDQINKMLIENEGGDIPVEQDNENSMTADNVKLSNFYYEKIIYQKACQCGFSLLVLALTIKTGYMRYNSAQWTPKTQPRPEDSKQLEQDSENLLMWANILSLVQLYNALIVKQHELSWQKSKMQIHPDETFFTTGMWKRYLVKCLMCLAQPWFFLAGVTYQDGYNVMSEGLHFQVNDLLTAIQIFFTMFPIYIFLIELTNWTTPKAQRCCAIFGVNANFMFGLKSLVLVNPVMLVMTAFLFSLIHLSLCMQILERDAQPELKNLTTAMWNIVITLTTVGYGDYYPKTNAGRFIGIVTAFWGVFFVSLFVVALTNILNLKEHEQRAYILLSRLFLRQELRENACKMIQSKYIIRSEEKKADQNDVKIRQNKLYYKKSQSKFQQAYQQLLTMNDKNAQNDQIQIGVDQLREDIEGMDDQHDVIKSHIADMTGNYEEAKDFLMTQFEKNQKWRKRHMRKQKKA